MYKGGLCTRVILLPRRRAVGARDSSVGGSAARRWRRRHLANEARLRFLSRLRGYLRAIRRLAMYVTSVNEIVVRYLSLRLCLSAFRFAPNLLAKTGFTALQSHLNNSLHPPISPPPPLRAPPYKCEFPPRRERGASRAGSCGGGGTVRGQSRRGASGGSRPPCGGGGEDAPAQEPGSVGSSYEASSSPPSSPSTATASDGPASAASVRSSPLTCVEINQCVGCTTRPRWPRRAVRNRHHHATP